MEMHSTTSSVLRSNHSQYWKSQSTPEFQFSNLSIIAIKTHLFQEEIRGFQTIYSINRNTSLSINKPRMQGQNHQRFSTLGGI